MDFFTGNHQPSDAQHFDRAFISVNRLRGRRSGFKVRDWIMDSGAFTQIMRHGGYTEGVEVYAAEIKRWAHNGNLLAAVAQDYMCEAHMLKITGMTIPEHQQLTIERYDALLACDTGGVYIMPVLQGYAPEDYVRHIDMYGERLGRVRRLEQHDLAPGHLLERRREHAHFPDPWLLDQQIHQRALRPSLPRQLIRQGGVPGVNRLHVPARELGSLPEGGVERFWVERGRGRVHS